MLERDKSLKLELDVTKSLNEDMTRRLTMSQRNIKQLNEKISTLEKSEQELREKFESELSKKVILFA